MLPWILTAAGVLAGAGLGLSLVSGRLARGSALTTPSDEVHHARTADGWLIGLHRYRPRGEGPVAAEPVLLCHGLLSSRFSLDLTEERSLARFLRDAGFDVWLMDLRAHGDSVRDGRSTPFRWGHRMGYDWSIDEHIREDLPAAVRYVLETTGASRLHWVGHSLGGMILYAHCLDGERGWFRSAVTIDSPGYMAPLKQPTWPGRLFARLVPVVPLLLFKPVLHFLYSLVPERVLYRAILLDRKTLRLILYNGLVERWSSLTLLHLARTVAAGRFQSFDGKRNYEEGPTRIEFPLLVLRAPLGRCPEACVRHAYETAATAQKEYVHLGRDGGFSTDHNHFSILIGDKAREDLYPVIADWLRRRSAGA
jgi:pimeloyl-ACP methyl ester carboxylesterase